MIIKLGPFKKLGPFSTFQLFKFSKLCYYFLSSFENDFFFLYPQLSPAHCRPEFYDQQNFAKKVDVSVYFQKKRKSDKFLWDPYQHFSFALFLLLKIYRNINFFGTIDWSMNSRRRWAGDSQGYKKKYIFHFRNSTINGKNVWTIKKAEMKTEVPTL